MNCRLVLLDANQATTYGLLNHAGKVFSVLAVRLYPEISFRRLSRNCVKTIEPNVVIAWLGCGCVLATTMACFAERHAHPASGITHVLVVASPFEV